MRITNYDNYDILLNYLIYIEWLKNNHTIKLIRLIKNRKLRYLSNKSYSNRYISIIILL